MCSEHQMPEMAGLHIGHLSAITRVSSDESGIVSDIYQALTTYLNPHLPALPAFVAMAEAFHNNDFGILGEHRLVRLPLSVIGTDKVRYRTEVVEWLHETILSMRMSDITVEAVRNTLRPHGLCVLFLCSCGIVMGRCEDVRAYYGSDEHKRMDRLRSAIDADGNPVRSVGTLDDINVPTMDLHSNGAEARLFARIEELTRLAAVSGHQDYDWINAELQYFINKAESLEVAA